MTARFYSILTALLAVLACTACQPEPAPAPAPDPGTASTVADPDAGMTLTVAADRAELSTTDRLRVTITLTRPVANPVTLTEPDWAADGWSVIDRTDAPARALTDHRIERQRTITLEPFLEGDYAVPPTTVSWGTQSAPRGLTTTAIPVAVASVLAADDTGELAAAVGAHPPQPDQPFNPILPVVTLALFLLAVAFVWRLTRPRQQHTEPSADPIRELAWIAIAKHDPDPAHLHRLLESLPPKQRRSVKPEIARCERARFAPDTQPDVQSPIDSPAIARAALERLGFTP